MAVSNTPSTLEIQKWRKRVWMEYQRENLFAPYIGTGTDAVIQRIYELKDEGESITIPIIGRLTGSGQVGSNTLVGNEESMDQYGFKVTIDWARHAIVLNKKEMRKAAIDQMELVRPMLTDWAAAKLRDDIVKAFFTVSAFGTAPSLSGNVFGIQYGAATAAQKNAWSDANSDRIMYGAAAGNLVAGNHAASLANVNTTSGTATAANLVALKRRAKKAGGAYGNHLRPIRAEEGREYFVAMMGSNTFADFGNDQAVISANTNARAREGSGMDKNPIFQDGDLLYKGIIAREVPEIDNFCSIANAGGGGTTVYPVFLCGQQALGYAVGQLPAPTTRNDDDYGFIKGRGIETCYGVGKVAKQVTLTNGTSALQDWGMATGFFASVTS